MNSSEKQIPILTDIVERGTVPESAQTTAAPANNFGTPPKGQQSDINRLNTGTALQNDDIKKEVNRIIKRHAINMQREIYAYLQLDKT